MFRNRSCPTCKPVLAPQTRPLVPKEPTWLTAPSLTEMVTCSDTLKLLPCAHIANTRHRWQDVHHPKCEQWDRRLPQQPGKMTGLGAVGCRKVALGSHWKMVLFLRAFGGDSILGSLGTCHQPAHFIHAVLGVTGPHFSFSCPDIFSGVALWPSLSRTVTDVWGHQSIKHATHSASASSQCHPCFVHHRLGFTERPDQCPNKGKLGCGWCSPKKCLSQTKVHGIYRHKPS